MTAQTNTGGWRRLIEARLVLVILLLVGMALALAVFQTGRVARHLEDLERATADNIPWNLAQLETEYLRLMIAAREAEVRHTERIGAGDENRLDQTDLAETRVRFDIFYSRTDTISFSPLYDVVRADPEFGAALERIRAFTVSFADQIDHEPARFAREFPLFLEAAGAIQPEVRSVALMGISLFSVMSDRERTKLAGLLKSIAASTAASIGLLLALLALFWFYAQRFRRTADAASLTATRLASIISTSPLPILISDEAGLLVEFNAAAEEAFGYQRSEVLGSDPRKLLLKGDRLSAEDKASLRAFTAYLDRARDPGQTYSEVFNLRLERRDGTLFPAEILVAERPERSSRAYIAFIRDVTTWEQAVSELRDARDRATIGERTKERLLATMSHEMRTPLHGMLAAVELLVASDLTPPQRRLATSLRLSAELLLRQSDDVLNAARLENEGIHIERRRVSIEQLMATVLADNQILVSSSGNELHLVAPEGATEDRVWCDPVRIKQVFYNLISNASKFTTNGTIEIGWRLRPETEELEFHVTDSGVGIPPAEHEKIFDDFYTAASIYTREHGGTGLGLGIVRRLVTAMGGRIWVESELGKGATFRFLVNCATPPEQAEPPAPAPVRAAPPPTGEALPEIDGRPIKVLFAEDNPINRGILADGLAAAGIGVVCVEDGLGAVEAAATVQFDVMLMDISMPGMDGMEATRRIRANPGPNRKTPIVALTAHAFPEQQEDIRTAGFDAVFVKPISISELTRMVRALGAGQTAGEIAPPPTHALTGRDAIDELREVFGRDHTAEIVEKFARETRAALGRLIAHAAEPKGRAAFLREAHSLRGSCGLLGARVLAERIGVLEDRVRDGGLDDVGSGLDGLEKLAEDSVEELRRAL